MAISIRNPRVAGRVFDTPLLVEPGKAAAVLWGLSGRVGEIEAVVQEGRAVDPREHRAGSGQLAAGARRDMGVVGQDLKHGAEQSGRRLYDVIEGAAIIPVEGTLVHKGKWVGAWSGETSYEGLSAQIAQAAEDRAVKGIVLEVDSFGGEAQGAFDLTDQIFALAQAKPVRAILTENACSAGYAIASAAERIAIPRTGLAGSIGVVMLHADFSGFLDEAGITVTLIHAGARKVDGNPYEPLPEDVRDRFQASVERTRDLFVETVGRNRGDRLTAERARATEAGVFEGQEAVAAGLADQVAAPLDALESFLSELRGARMRPGSAPGGAEAQSTEGATAMTLADVKQDETAATARAQSDDRDDEAQGPDHDDDEDERRRPYVADGEDESKEAAGEDAADGDDESVGAQTVVGDPRRAERVRVRGILTAKEAKGRAELAGHLAYETDLPVEDAVAMLARAPRSGGLAEKMDAAPQPDIGAGPPSPGTDRAAQMIGAFKAAGGGYRVRED